MTTDFRNVKNQWLHCMNATTEKWVCVVRGGQGQGIQLTCLLSSLVLKSPIEVTSKLDRYYCASSGNLGFGASCSNGMRFCNCSLGKELCYRAGQRKQRAIWWLEGWTVTEVSSTGCWEIFFKKHIAIWDNENEFWPTGSKRSNVSTSMIRPQKNTAVYGHATLNMPDLVWSRKLSRDRPS